MMMIDDKEFAKVVFVHKNGSGEVIAQEVKTLHLDDLEVEYLEWIRNYCMIEIGDTFSVEHY